MMSFNVPLVSFTSPLQLYRIHKRDALQNFKSIRDICYENVHYADNLKKKLELWVIFSCFFQIIIFNTRMVSYWYSCLMLIISGNTFIHILTTSAKYELRVDLETIKGQKTYAIYKTFTLGDAASQYQLTVHNYSGTAGNL